MALGACQNKQMKDPKAALERVAETYWEKRFLEKDYGATYTMELDQEAMTLEKYKAFIANKGDIQYVSVKAKSAKVEGSNGTVNVLVTYSLKNLRKELTSTMFDRWVIIENEWKHVLSKK